MKPNAKSAVVANGTGSRPERSLKQQMLRGGVAGFLVRVGSVLSGLVASVVLARLLGPENYGIYAFVFSIITIVGLPVKIGLPTLILRETAWADQAADGPLMHGIWRWSDRAVMLTSMVVLSVAALYVWLVHRVETPHMVALLCALPLVPLIGLAEVRGASIRGLRRVALGVAPDKIGRPLLLAGGAVLASWLISPPMSAAHVFVIHGAAAMATVIALMVIRSQIAPRYSAGGTLRTKPKTWVAAILPLAAIAGLQVISQNTDILMLGILASDAEVGLYRVALSAANVSIFCLTVVTLVMQPYLARAWQAGDDRLMQLLATVGARVSVTGALPVVMLFYFAGHWLLSLVYGVAYLDAYWAMVVLCLGQFVNAVFAMNVTLLTLSGREWIAFSCGVVSTMINLALNWYLIPQFGIQGAAFATGMSIVILNVTLCGSVWMQMRIDSSPLGLKRTPS